MCGTLIVCVCLGNGLLYMAFLAYLCGLVWGRDCMLGVGDTEGERLHTPRPLGLVMRASFIPHSLSIVVVAHPFTLHTFQVLSDICSSTFALASRRIFVGSFLRWASLYSNATIVYKDILLDFLDAPCSCVYWDLY